MSVQLSHASLHTETNAEPLIVNGELRCALTGRVVSADEAYWAPPLITTRELVRTVVQTLFTSPRLLGQALMSDMPNVPYAPEARELLARRRSMEQVKLLGVLLLLAAILLIPILLLLW